MDTYEIKIKVETVKALVDRMHIPFVYGWEEAIETFREFIFKALPNDEWGDEGQRFHICNEVVNEFGGNLFRIGYTYEDRNLNSMEEALEFFDVLDHIVPGYFVLIDTGDYIVPKCGTDNGGYHRQGNRIVDCEVYDPHYWYYIIPRNEWEAFKDDLLDKDRIWRENAMKCKLESK